MSFLFKDCGKVNSNCLTIRGMECPFYSRTMARSTVTALLFEGWNVLFIQGLWQGQQ